MIRLLLDEHYSETIAAALRGQGHDVIAAAADPELRGVSDPVLFLHAAATGRRIVTENIKDFRPLLIQAIAADAPAAALLLVSPRRFPRGGGDRTAVIAAALASWLEVAKGHERPLEDWVS